MADCKSEPLCANRDPLNVLGDVVRPLSQKAMTKIIKGMTERMEAFKQCWGAF